MQKMCSLEVGKLCRVKKLSATASDRRRLLDIGFTEKSIVRCVGVSPLGDPKAYLVRGAVNALRNKDAQNIFVELLPEEST